MTDQLTQLLQRLDEPAARFHRLDQYYAGEQPLTYLAPDARKALGDRLTAVSVNIPRLLVESVGERLRVTGFSGVDVWPEWLANDLDQCSHILHREVLTLGCGFVIVWAHPDGTPNVSVESARQVAVLTDPGTRRVTAAVKRWETATTTEVVLYQPDVITRLRAKQTGATVAGFRTVETLDNPLGQVPVVPFVNRSRLLDEGRSEMSDVLDLTDCVVKLMSDMMVSSEFTARPRRFATGVELEEVPVLDENGQDTGETVSTNPFPEGSRMLLSENDAAKFGQLPGSDLSGYENALGVVMRQISAVSGLPEHLLGIGADSAMSADAIRSAESALTARAEAKHAALGRSWETVARLMVAVRDGVDPDSVHPRIAWADPSTRSVAQEADATVKLYAAGLLPASYALKRLGYTADEIDEIIIARQRDSVANLDLGRVFK